VAAAVVGSAIMAAIPAHGAQVYVQPIVSAEVQSSSNVSLETDNVNHRQVEGYFADAAAVMGIATPRSDTTLRPRLLYRYYPDDSDLNRLEAFLDLATQFDSQRSHFRMFGRFDHRDETQAERAAADFNDVTPTPDSPETGRVRIGATRDLLLLMPDYRYNLTQRTDIGAAATLQSLSYSPDDATSHVDFNYYLGKGYLRWSLSPRTDLAVGAFTSRYDAKNIDSQSTSYGVSGDLDVNWSAILSSSVSVNYQRADIDRTEPTVFKDKTNAWGAIVGTTYKGQLSRVRFTLGRSITPSGSGGLYNSDSVRVQYERDLTPRWELTTAARYLRNRALSRDVTGNDRNYTRAEVELKWMVTPTWFVQAGYEYTWQKYENDPFSAADNSFALRVGYQGLPRQR
jgi:hypothetical protein